MFYVVQSPIKRMQETSDTRHNSNKASNQISTRRLLCGGILNTNRRNFKSLVRFFRQITNRDGTKHTRTLLRIKFQKNSAGGNDISWILVLEEIGNHLILHACILSIDRRLGQGVLGTILNRIRNHGIISFSLSHCQRTNVGNSDVRSSCFNAQSNIASLGQDGVGIIDSITIEKRRIAVAGRNLVVEFPSSRLVSSSRSIQ
mmetsp:Transcript_13680/g.24771  ORF Transcript_13680/g.24771 Transcript_13680/m.24771 type:complete len:202 (+) Transcript_13680:528-1133(+)